MIRDRPRTSCPTRPKPRTPAAAALLLLGVAAGGCSFAALRPAPPPRDWPQPVTPHSSQWKCTRTPAPPIADTGIALGLGGLAYVERNSGAHWFSPIVGAAAVPFVVSAVYGYFTSARCREYQDLFRGQVPDQK